MSRIAEVLTFRNAPIFVALGSALCVVVSVSYDWGYFRVIGPRFFYNLSLSDHVAAALDRIPPMIFSGLVIAPLGYITYFLGLKALDRSLNDFGTATRTFMKAKISEARFKILVIGILPCFLVLFFLYAALGLFVEGGYYMSAWFIVGIALSIGLKTIGDNLERNAFRAIAMFGMLVIVPIVFGHVAGARDLRAKEGKQAIFLKDGTSVRSAVILRYSSSSVLMRDVGNTSTRLITWDSIKEIVQPGNFEPTAPACIYFDYCYPSGDR